MTAAKARTARTELSSEGAIVRTADALLGALALLVIEALFVAGWDFGQFAGLWEARAVFLRVVPTTWVLSGPLALLGAWLLATSEACARNPRGEARWILSATGMLFGGAAAWSVSSGRHFAAIAVRGGFAFSIALAGAALTYALAPPIGRLARTQRTRTALGALACALVLELANRRILPGLYPGFHAALAVLTLLLAPLVALAFRDDPSQRLRAGMGLTLVVAAAAAVPSAATALALHDNMRMLVLRDAPLLAHGVTAAARLTPPAPLESPDDLAPGGPGRYGRGEGARLAWDKRDIVLISVDALRADHVGAYGHDRATTPHLDALAKDGVVFDRVYCPTPHTSYSVTSLMTGKNMRSLLLQGLGSDSDTFAGLLRTYGYRTAAFYPPAVFFIDGERFTGFRDRHLDFEYARVEFASATERAAAVERYLTGQPAERRVFLWVHLFEPHEPYVAHAEHPFGDRDIDRYDAEIAAADDGIGAVVTAVRSRRPHAVFIVTADHGEEFGEHGGRYHGTAVYEEQVRVPLVVVADGIILPGRVRVPVQTIDILPTTLAALSIPVPPRVRGRDLGRLLADPKHGANTDEPGFAFAETEEQTLLARGALRLVCARKVGACALYDLENDPGETRDASAPHLEQFDALKKALRQVEASHGRFESAGLKSEGRSWPEPIRRGIAGDADASREIAALLDDADVVNRRKAAEVLFDLKREDAAPELRLAVTRDEDEEVRRFAALALTRLGQGAPLTVELLHTPEAKWQRLAALALAESGDARGADVLVRWWDQDPPAFARARDVLGALARTHPKSATVPLVRSLADVRLRPYVAAALGAIGEPYARGPLSHYFAEERHAETRLALAEALVELGSRYELAPPLARFLGTPDPMPGGLRIAERAKILAQVGGPTEKGLAPLRAGEAERGLLVKVLVPTGGNGRGRRVLVRARSRGEAPVEIRIGAPLVDTELPSHHPHEGGTHEGPRRAPELDPRRSVTLTFTPGEPQERFADLPAGLPLTPPGVPLSLVVYAAPLADVQSLAVVPLSDELPPPPPEPWTPETIFPPATPASFPPTTPASLPPATPASPEPQTAETAPEKTLEEAR